MIKNLLIRSASNIKPFECVQLSHLTTARASKAVSKPRLYAEVNAQMPKSYSDYHEYEYKLGNSDDYEITGKLGRGKYSEVFEGFNVLNGDRVVIKMLKPVKPEKIKRELKILETLKGGPNIVTLQDVVRPIGQKMSPTYVLEYLENHDFRWLYPRLSDLEVRYYMFEILKALDYAHSKGIMHRDIKPQNVMINSFTKRLKLIDWGLAEFYHVGQAYNVRVASRCFKGPELLVDDEYYDYSLDVWSLGAMFAGIIFKKEPFFKGESNEDQLVKILDVLGTDKLQNYLIKYKLKLSSRYRGLIHERKEVPWSSFVNRENSHLANPEAIDLLSKMLVFDKADRILPKEAMEHTYFDPVRQKTASELFIEKK